MASSSDQDEFIGEFSIKTELQEFTSSIKSFLGVNKLNNRSSNNEECNWDEVLFNLEELEDMEDTRFGAASPTGQSDQSSDKDDLRSLPSSEVTPHQGLVKKTNSPNEVSEVSSDRAIEDEEQNVIRKAAKRKKNSARGVVSELSSELSNKCIKLEESSRIESTGDTDPILELIRVPEDDRLAYSDEKHQKQLQALGSAALHLRRRGIVSTIPKPLLSFFYDLMNAFNGCQLNLINKIIDQTVDDDVNLKIVTPAFSTNKIGKQEIKKLYAALLDSYPDAVAVERDSKVISEKGRIVLYSKFYYTGTKAFALSTDKCFRAPSSTALTDAMDKSSMTPEQLASFRKFEQVINSNGDLVLVHAVGFKKLYINPRTFKINLFYVEWKVTNFRSVVN